MSAGMFTLGTALAYIFFCAQLDPLLCVFC